MLADGVCGLDEQAVIRGERFAVVSRQIVFWLFQWWYGDNRREPPPIVARPVNRVAERFLVMARHRDARRGTENLVVEMAEYPIARTRRLRMAARLRRVFGRPERSGCFARLHREPRRASSRKDVSG